jgi:lysyl-tRNA synthetase class 2
MGATMTDSPDPNTPDQPDEPLDRPDDYHPAGRYPVDTTCAEAPSRPDDQVVHLAGRVVLWRVMGGRVFGHIQDQTGRVQVSLEKKALGAEVYTPWAKGVKLGDFIGVTGQMWTTNSGERTVAISDMTILTRAFRPMPDKWAGVSDTELRYRKRYLDLLVNPESRERFLTRTKVVSALRRFLDDNRFLEIETPILQGAASGAAARPFSTHHNALDRDFFLRISPETYLKRVVAGSFDRVYELGRNFRNEGVDSSHLQEFTMLEWYAAYWDYEDNIRFTQAMIQAAVDAVQPDPVVSFQGTELDFGGEWPVIDYRDAVREHTGIDLHAIHDLVELKAAIKAADVPGAGDVSDAPSYASLVDLLYKRTVRPSLVQPCFLVHHPAELVPLARRSDEDGTRLDMFQVVVHGWEIAKGYSELVDPFEQRARLEEQLELRAAGDDETMMMEDDFIEAMEHGMPPMSGVGIGIDRLVALLTDAPTLRDVVLFPQMQDRPERGGAGDGGTADDGGTAEERGPADDGGSAES